MSEAAAQAAGAPQVLEKGENLQKSNDYTRGDVEKGFKEADLIFERTYQTSWEVHQPTETHGSVAYWENDYLTVHDSTQAVQGVRDGLARALGIPAGRVRVLKDYMGGGFGSKLGVNDYTITAARLAREAGRPGQDRPDAAREFLLRRLPAGGPDDGQGRGEEGRHAHRPGAQGRQQRRDRTGRPDRLAFHRPLQGART